MSDDQIIRAMASTLVDQGVDLNNSITVGLTLMSAGFRAKEIDTHWKAVMAMALVRQRNSQ